MCVDPSSASSCHIEITMKTLARTLRCQPVSEDTVRERIMVIAILLTPLTQDMHAGIPNKHI